MFTTEIRINGTMIAHIYGRNIGSNGKEDRYTYEYYAVEDRKVRSGKVSHRREDGIRKLIVKILNEVEKI